MAPDAREAAVSSVVGTVLMMAVTVTVFGGFAIVVLGELQDGGHAPRSDLAIVSADESLLLTHRGGESFGVQGETLFVNRDGYEVEVVLDDAGLAAYGKTMAGLGLGDGWGTGDTLCVWGESTSCLFDPDEAIVGGAFLVVDGRLLMDDGERGIQGPAPSPDLVVDLDTPTSPYAGQAVQWNVRVTNTGLGRMSSASVLVNVQVDGGLVATATVPGPILAGASATASSTPAWTAVVGSHALLLTVDPTNLVVESDDANNQHATALSVAVGTSDPGEPFIDLNGDGLYTPGVDTDITPAQVQQIENGSFNAGSGSLVLPPSLGDISAGTISFVAGGDIVVAVELTATTNPLTISAGGDIVFDSAELQTLNNNNDMTLSAGGSITATDLVIDVDGSLTITASDAIDFTGAHVTVDFSNRDLAITGRIVTLTNAVLYSSDQLTITSANGAIAASGVQATSVGTQLWKSTGGGITLSSATLTGSSLTACLASSTTDGLVLAGVLAIDDANDRLNAQRASTCNTDANADAYVTPWDATNANTSPRNKLE